VATGAIGGGREAAMVYPCTSPAGCVVTAFARVRAYGMNGWLGMASGTLVGKTDTGVQARRCPGCESSFVASVAVGDSYTRQALIRRMVDGAAIRWRERAAMAGGTLVGDRDLSMVEFGGLPTRHAVATEAIGCARWNMGC
jgi:hypothetical protein